jgi:hypothetical protein
MSSRAGQFLPEGIIPAHHALPLHLARQYLGSPDARQDEIFRRRNLRLIATSENLDFSDLCREVRNLTEHGESRFSDDAGDVGYAVHRLADAIHAREQSFLLGVRKGVYLAFGRMQSGGPFRLISAEAWPEELSLFFDIHIVDTFGIGLDAAVKLFVPPHLAAMISRLEDQGASPDSLYPDPTKVMLLKGSLTKAQNLIRERVAAGELIAKGLTPADFAPDPWTGERPRLSLSDRLFRLPAPSALCSLASLTASSDEAASTRGYAALDRPYVLAAIADRASNPEILSDHMAARKQAVQFIKDHPSCSATEDSVVRRLQKGIKTEREAAAAAAKPSEQVR